MTPETKKQLRYQDHDQKWAPQYHYAGPWNPWATAKPAKRSHGRRLAFVYIRDAAGNETIKTDM